MWIVRVISFDLIMPLNTGSIIAATSAIGTPLKSALTSSGNGRRCSRAKGLAMQALSR